MRLDNETRTAKSYENEELYLFECHTEYLVGLKLNPNPFISFLIFNVSQKEVLAVIAESRDGTAPETETGPV